MIIYTTGNIFNSNAQVITNTVNCVGVMGKGIALQFKRKFPEMFLDVKIDAVQALLGVSKNELAQFFEMSSDELTDDKVTAKNKGKLVELASAIEYVTEAFKGDLDKTKFWFKTPNPNFGDSSPQQLIMNGRSQYVVKFILASRNGY